MTAFIKEVSRASLFVLGFALWILPLLLDVSVNPFVGLALLAFSLAAATLFIGTQ